MTQRFKFHKDQFGAHVYYAGMNKDANGVRSGMMLNNTIEFNPMVTCVVPMVTRLSTTKTETQIKHYRHKTTGHTKHPVDYRSEESQLNSLLGSTGLSREDEITARVDLSRLTDEWLPEDEEIEKHIDFEFEIIDIEYPADERLVPLRHIGGTSINYFEVDGERVAINMIHNLCKGAKLKNDTSNKRYTYRINRWRDEEEADEWRIEGERYGEPLISLKLSQNFAGNLPECRDRINEIECAVRECYDNWLISGKSPDRLTVGFVTAHLDEIARNVRGIQTKIKTKGQFDRTLAKIELAKTEVLQLGGESLEDNE